MAENHDVESRIKIWLNNMFAGTLRGTEVKLRVQTRLKGFHHARSKGPQPQTDQSRVQWTRRVGRYVL